MDSFNPFIGNHIGFDYRMQMAWWPSSKSTGPDGSRLRNKAGYPMNTRLSWFSWGPDKGKLGTLLGALTTCMRNSRDKGCALVGAAVVCEEVVTTCDFPHSIVRRAVETRFERAWEYRIHKARHIKDLTEAIIDGAWEDIREDLILQVGDLDPMIARSTYQEGVVEASQGSTGRTEVVLLKSS
jgi:hypothetical protein